MEMNHDHENELLLKDGIMDNIQHDGNSENGTSNHPNNQNSHNIAPARSVHYAGFWMRFWAYILDLIVIGSIERILVNPLFRFLDIPLWEINMFAPISIASAVIFYLYFVLMTKFFGQTLGKMVFGIKVVDLKKKELSWGTVLFREWIGRFISSTIIIGYIIAAFLPYKQGIHDLFAETSVVHIERK